MARLRGCDSQNASTQRGFFKPARYRALQNPRPVGAKPATRDNQHTAPAAAIADLDKFAQLTVRLGLGAAVEIESCLDGVEPALEPLGIGTVDTRKPFKRRRFG